MKINAVGLRVVMAERKGTRIYSLGSRRGFGVGSIYKASLGPHSNRERKAGVLGEWGLCPEG